MLLTDRVQLREKKQMLQQQFATVPAIDTTTYCKIKKGERCAKYVQLC
jgi:DNA-binding XRE family transcriptional regulator